MIKEIVFIIINEIKWHSLSEPTYEKLVFTVHCRVLDNSAIKWNYLLSFSKLRAIKNNAIFYDKIMCHITPLHLTDFPNFSSKSRTENGSHENWKLIYWVQGWKSLISCTYQHLSILSQSTLGERKINWLLKEIYWIRTHQFLYDNTTEKNPQNCFKRIYWCAEWNIA